MEQKARMTAQDIYSELEAQDKRGQPLHIPPEWEVRLQELADNADPLASYWLGAMRLSQEEDVDNAWRLVQTAADQGLLQAARLISTHQFQQAMKSGSDTPLTTEVVAIWATAARHGDYVAQYLLAEHGGSGPVPLQDTERLMWLKQSADSGYLTAELRLAECHFYGDLGCQDVSYAADVFEDLASSGYPIAAVWCALLFLEGLGRRRDAQRAAHYLDQYALMLGGPDPASFRIGYADGCTQLGLMYATGVVGDLPEEEAYRKGAYLLAWAIHIGDGSSVPRLIALARAHKHFGQTIEDAFRAVLKHPSPPLSVWTPNAERWSDSLQIE